MRGHRKGQVMIARRIRNCREDSRLKLLEEAQRMVDSGEDIFNLALEEDECFELENYEEREENSFESLENMVLERLRIDKGLNYSKENILLTNGFRSSLSLVLQTILNPQDEVIIPLPHPPGFPEMVQLLLGKPILLHSQAGNDYKLTPIDLKKAVTEKTRAIILSNPLNSTGMVYTIDELLGLSEIVVENKLILISDETSEDFIYEGKNHISIVSLNKEVKNISIVISDFSGCLSKRQSHLSYLAANEMIIKGMKKIQNYMVSEPSASVKEETVRALRSREWHIDKRLAFLKGQRQTTFNYLDGISGLSYIKSQASPYVLVDISRILEKKQHAINSETSLGFCEALLKRANTLAMPGEVFGMPGMVRLCFAVAGLEKGLENLIEFIEKY